jgi:hypothetical protein
MKPGLKACVIFGTGFVFSVDSALRSLSAGDSQSRHLGALSAGNTRSEITGSEVWQQERLHIISPVLGRAVRRKQKGSVPSVT